MERLTVCTIHAGVAFTADNGDLYSLIAQHTEGTEGCFVYTSGQENQMAFLCPNQLRMNGVYVDDRPSVPFPGIDDTQSIIIDGTKIPLHMNGLLMEIHVRRPTLSEITNDDLQLVTLTSLHGWDPYGDASVTSYHVSSIMSVLPWGNPTITSMIYQKKNLLGSTKRRSITVDNLMERWGVGKETAKVTLEPTWKESTRSTDNLTRRLKTARVHSRYRHLMGPHSVFYTDTLFSSTVSLHGNRCDQVYFNKCHFYKVYPLKSKGDSHMTLIPLFEVAGLLSQMHSDRAPDIVAGKFSQLLRKYRIRQSTVETNSPWQNQVEG